MDLNELARRSHDHVHVGSCRTVLFVVQVQNLLVSIDAHTDSREGLLDRLLVRFEHALALHPFKRIVESDICTRDGGAASAAIGLDRVAIDRDRALADDVGIHYRSERSPDETADLKRSTVGLHVVALVSLATRAGKHVVLSRHPAATLALEEWGNPVFYRGGDQHMGLTHLDEARALRKLGKAPLKGKRSEFIGPTAIVSHGVESTGFGGGFQ